MKDRWKRRLRGFPAVLSAVVLCLSMWTTQVEAADGYAWVKVKVTFGQTEARSMLKMINEFRMGKEAWAWDENNQRKEYKCKALKYDYDLERIAMLRAAELALAYSHTRPNGKSCFTAHNGGIMCGENIAAGYGTAAEVFEGWKETDKPYSGQGHRRNMLNPGYTAVGIGHVYYNGYHYWAQEFRSPVSDAGKTAANDAETEMKLEILLRDLKDVSLTPSVNKIVLAPGKTINVPQLVIQICMKQSWGGWVQVEMPYTWKAGGGGYLTVSDGKITGVKCGTTKVTATVLGKTVKVPVIITETGESDEEDESDEPGVFCAGDVRYIIKQPFGGKKTAVVAGAAKKNQTSVTIPDTVKLGGVKYKVTEIGTRAFEKNESLKTVSIGKNVTKIGFQAFFCCENLTTVKGCKGIEVIESSAFYRCSSVQKISIPSASLTKIGSGAFASCTGMTGFTTKSKKLASIGIRAFYGDKKLSSVTLKTEKLKKNNVGYNAFKGIWNKCKFKVPARKVSAYKKLFQEKGAGKGIVVGK